ncbi:MAG: response regulator transcription factor [Acidobacteriaceae bacterium]
MRLLIIEDEPRMLQLLRQGLYEHGFAVMTAADGEAGLAIATSCDFDAILLDIGLPRRDGWEFMRLLRERGRHAAVLMLTARDAEDDIIRGLNLGADDYMTKPFSFPELVARLQAITRPRREESSPSRIEVGGLVVDPLRHEVTRGNQTIDLTHSEFLLLSCLLRHAGECVSRQSLMEGVWGAEREVGSGALDVLVNSLRSKIDAQFRDKLIGTIRRSGYIFRHDAAAAGSRTQ